MIFLVLSFSRADLDYHVLGSAKTSVRFVLMPSLHISMDRLCLDVKRLASVYSVAVIVRRTSGSFPINDLNAM
jgi:hypothetical protein